MLSIGRGKSTSDISLNDPQIEEVSFLDVFPEPSENVDLDRTLNRAISPTFVSNEPYITQIRPEAIWNKYYKRSEEGDFDATYILAFILNECRDVGNDGFIDHIMRSTSLPVEIREQEISRYDRCMPLISNIDDPADLYDRLSQILRDEMHPLTVVNIPGIPSVSKKDRLIVAVLREYPEKFMYERAYMAAIRYHREYVDNPDVFRQEAWTLLYCEANLHCNSNEYRRNLQSVKYRQHEYDEILDIEESIRKAIRDRDPSALGF